MRDWLTWTIATVVLWLAVCYCAMSAEPTVTGCRSMELAYWMQLHGRAPKGCFEHPVAGLKFVTSTPHFTQFEYTENLFVLTFWTTRETGDRVQCELNAGMPCQLVGDAK